MELECAKYHEKVDGDHPACPHPEGYCRFRTSCMIHFLEKENRRDAAVQLHGSAGDKGEQGSGGT
jgi:hypothetical protein